MKKNALEFMRRGFSASGLGPIILAILYLILRQQGKVQTLTVDQLCVGIFSLSALAFVAGGMNVIYQVEQLPLMVAVLIHGVVLYVCYLITYLINGWIGWGVAPILVFTGIFVIGYLIIWGIIYFIIKKNTEQINEALKKKEKNTEGEV